MKSKALMLLGGLIVAAGVAFGVNTALGDPPSQERIPQEPKPESTPEPAPPDPYKPIDVTPYPDDLSVGEGAHITINGKDVTLPAGARLSTVHNEYAVGEGPLPGWPQEYNTMTMGDSTILFTFDGVILDSRIQPQDAEALRPVIEQLKPR